MAKQVHRRFKGKPESERRSQSVSEELSASSVTIDFISSYARTILPLQINPVIFSFRLYFRRIYVANDIDTFYVVSVIHGDMILLYWQNIKMVNGKKR